MRSRTWICRLLHHDDLKSCQLEDPLVMTTPRLTGAENCAANWRDGSNHAFTPVFGAKPQHSHVKREQEDVTRLKIEAYLD